jgi:protein-tyrosine phosphatase
MDLPIAESYWVQPGRFLAGEHPGGFNADSARRRLDAFLKAGINTFIDLTQPQELTSYEGILKEQAGSYKMDAIYHRFAIRDHSIPSHGTMARILDTIDEALGLGRNVYVHCYGGIGRAGTTVGCYLVRHGQANQEAVLQVNKLYKTRPKNPYYPNSPETQEQIQFVLDWREIPGAIHQSRQDFCEG